METVLILMDTVTMKLLNTESLCQLNAVI